VCAECGLLVEEHDPVVCPRCGTRFDD
jgi:DNA-directed RNA polymerase subunit RPC12/RpoP